MRLTLVLSGAVLAAVFFFTPTAAHAGLIVANGSFETGDFTGWTTGGNFSDTEVVTGGFYVYTGAEDGSDYAVLGPVGSDGTLSQTLTTIPAGNYTFSFWLNAVGDDPSDFSASWDGTPLYSQSDPTTGNVWTQFSFNVTGTGSDTIAFSFRDDPAYIVLDNISVSSSSSATPEPGTLPLVLTGSLAMAAVIRRKLRARR
jgi:hypothetical protein